MKSEGKSNALASIPNMLETRTALAERMDKLAGELGRTYVAFGQLTAALVRAGAPALPADRTHVRQALARALNEAGCDFVPPMSVGHADSVAEVAAKGNQGIRAAVFPPKPKEVVTHNGEPVFHDGEKVTA